jgi:polyferredoxin
MWKMREGLSRWCGRNHCEGGRIRMKKRWYNYLWIFSSVYLVLGLFNILFAWLGLICFITPLMVSVFGGGKVYCNRYCGRGQLFELLGGQLGLSRKKIPPKFLRSAWFRYGFLTFFMAMFLLMIYNTYLVFAGAQLKEAVTLLWVFRLPWQWTNTSFVSPGIAQFAFGFYGVMLTSTVLGLITMGLFRPRFWCVYCPMGTMTQAICNIKHGKEEQEWKKKQNKSPNC